MATPEQVLTSARALGKEIASLDAARRMQEAIKSLQQDTSAQRAMADLNRAAAAIEQKAATGRPIEIEDKRRIETLRNAVITHPVLIRFQSARMDFLDLMRRIDEALAQETGGMSEIGLEALSGDPGAAPSAGPVLL